MSIDRSRLGPLSFIPEGVWGEARRRAPALISSPARSRAEGDRTFETLQHKLASALEQLQLNRQLDARELSIKSGRGGQAAVDAMAILIAAEQNIPAPNPTNGPPQASAGSSRSLFSARARWPELQLGVTAELLEDQASGGLRLKVSECQMAPQKKLVFDPVRSSSGVSPLDTSAEISLTKQEDGSFVGKAIGSRDNFSFEWNATYHPASRAIDLEVQTTELLEQFMGWVRSPIRNERCLQRRVHIEKTG
jgi:hypothetical protein